MPTEGGWVPSIFESRSLQNDCPNFIEEGNPGIQALQNAGLNLSKLFFMVFKNHKNASTKTESQKQSKRNLKRARQHPLDSSQAGGGTFAKHCPIGQGWVFFPHTSSFFVFGPLFWYLMLYKMHSSTSSNHIKSHKISIIALYKTPCSTSKLFLSSL